MRWPLPPIDAYRPRRMTSAWAIQAAPTKRIMIRLSPIATPSSGGNCCSTRTIRSDKTWMFAPVPITSGIDTSPNPLHAISSTAPGDRGSDRRQRDAPERPQESRARDARGFLERGVDVAEPRRDQQERVGDLVDRVDEDQAGERVDVERPGRLVDPDPAEHVAEPDVEEAGSRRHQQHPRGRSRDRRQQERDQRQGRGHNAHPRICPLVDPREHARRCTSAIAELPNTTMSVFLMSVSRPGSSNVQPQSAEVEVAVREEDPHERPSPADRSRSPRETARRAGRTPKTA